MDRKQLNRTGMMNTVGSYMDANNSIWNANIAMGETVTELKFNNAGIADKLAKQQTPITGAGDEKEHVRLDFEEKICEIADQLVALGEKSKNHILVAQSDTTLPQLDKMDVDVLEETGGRIIDLATANLAALAPYDVDAADLTELGDLKTSFGKVKNSVRTAIAGRSGETKTIPQLIVANTSLLRRRLDRQMTKFKKSNPEFYAGYHSARVVVDRHGNGGAKPATPVPPVPA